MIVLIKLSVFLDDWSVETIYSTCCLLHFSLLPSSNWSIIISTIKKKGILSVFIST